MKLKTAASWLSRVKSGPFRQTLVAVGLVLLAGLSGVSSARADLYITDGDQVDRYTNSGQLVTASFVSLLFPTGLAIGPAGNLFVGTTFLSSGGAGVMRYDAHTGSQVGAGPFVDFTVNPADNVNNPAGMRFGPDGNLYIADITSNDIHVYNPSGTSLGTLESPFLDQPTGLTFGPGGTLYVASAGNILKYDSGTNTFSVFVQGSGTNGISNPLDLVQGADGNLYFLDIGGSTSGIFQVDPSTAAVQKIADYSTSPFFGQGLMEGVDGRLYVSGFDAFTGLGKVLSYDPTTFSPGGGFLAGTDFIDGQITGLGFAAAALVETGAAIPEPSTWGLAGIVGLVAIVFVRRRRRASPGV